MLTIIIHSSLVVFLIKDPMRLYAEWLGGTVVEGYLDGVTYFSPDNWSCKMAGRDNGNENRMTREEGNRRRKERKAKWKKSHLSEKIRIILFKYIASFSYKKNTLKSIISLNIIPKNTGHRKSSLHRWGKCCSERWNSSVQIQMTD